jgi:hypothetical protein
MAQKMDRADILAKTRDELEGMAREHGVSGPTQLGKDDLVNAVDEAINGRVQNMTTREKLMRMNREELEERARKAGETGPTQKTKDELIEICEKAS